MRSLPFLLREALVNLTRHSMMTAAAISTLSAALVLCGAFALTSLQVVHIARHHVDTFEMRVFCRPETSAERLAEIRSRLVRLPGVRKVEFIPKEAAFAEQVKGLPIDTDTIPNVFPHTYVVRFDNPSAAGKSAATVRGWHGEVDGVDVMEEELAMAMRVAGFLGKLGAATGLALLAGALLVVMNTIRLSVHDRRREIQIMRIVGATGAFIRLPMVLEGMLHGLAAGTLATGILWGADRAVRSLVNGIPLLANGTLPFDAPLVALWLATGGILVGAAGSLFALRRHLRMR
ncbi:MAG: cell division protein FtsX [Armatimonadaceae bacterium]